RHIEQAFDQRSGARQVTQHRIIAVVLVDHPDQAELRAAIRAVPYGADRLIGEVTRGKAGHYHIVGYGPREDEALDHRRAPGPNQLQFVHRLDALGNRLHVQSASQADDGSDDRSVGIARIGASAHETAVDLDLVEWPAAQESKRRT